VAEVTQEETLLVLKEVVEIFSELKISYFVGGSVASGAHGEFRSTNDIDIVCSLDRAQVAPFIKLAQAKFYADEEAISQAVFDSRSFNIIHNETFIKVDIFTKTGPLEKAEMERATELIALGDRLSARIATSEYIVLAKLRWWELGGRVSDRQLRDIRGVLSVADKKLDKSYLDRWAKELGLYELLQEITDKRLQNSSSS